MIEITVLIKHDFDNFENHDPHYETIIGFLPLIDRVENNDQIMEKLLYRIKSLIMSYEELYKDKQYKGWDGNTYPKFSYKIIKRLDTHIINFPPEDLKPTYSYEEK